MTKPDPQQRGFHHSPARMFVELGIVLGSVLVAILLAVNSASWLSERLVDKASVAWEEQLGAVSWAYLAPDEKRCNNPELSAYLDTITGPLIEALDSPYKFKFVVVDESDANAFALPGGFIVVHRGLLETAESGEEIAAILAREIHHVTERHGLKRMARQLSVWSLVGWALGYIDLGALAAVVVGLVNTGYDLGQERDADRLGHALLRRADIDPKGMAIFLSRVAEKGADGPRFFSSHPAPEERAAAALALPALGTQSRVLPSPSAYGCFQTQ